MKQKDWMHESSKP